MHSKQGTTWKGVILRRRERINELALNVEISKAYAIGKNLEQYQKENKQSKGVAAVFETSLSQIRRDTLAKSKSVKSSRSKRRKSRINVSNHVSLSIINICMNR